MPKLICRPLEATTIRDNVQPGVYAHTAEPVTLARVTHSQAKLLQAAGVQLYKSLDTTDRGGPRQLAKRWYRYFAEARDVLRAASSTPSMLGRANAALGRTVSFSA